jgi:hypothetical protein
VETTYHFDGRQDAPVQQPTKFELAIDIMPRRFGSSSKSFWTVARNPQGKQVWSLLGPADTGIEEARKKARRSSRARAASGRAEAETFGVVAGNWLKRHVEAKGLRSGS